MAIIGKEGKNGQPLTVTVSFTNPVSLTVFGANFPSPLYQSWFVRLNLLVTMIQINYQSIGIGAGIERKISLP